MNTKFCFIKFALSCQLERHIIWHSQSWLAHRLMMPDFYFIYSLFTLEFSKSLGINQMTQKANKHILLLSVTLPMHCREAFQEDYDFNIINDNYGVK